MRIISILAGGFLLAVSAVAQPRECPVVDVEAGSTTTAAVEATDCRLTEITGNNLLPTAFGRQYRLTLGQRGVQRFEVTGTGFGPALYVFTNTFALVAINGTGAATTAPNARIVVNLPAGVYRVVVAGRTATATGAFELKLTAEAARNCPTTDVTIGTPVQASFTETGCRFVDVNLGSTNEDPVAFYRVPVTRRGVLDLQTQSQLTTLRLALTPAQGAATPAFSGALSLTASLLPNTYLVSVSTRAQFGAYTLQSRLDDLRSCPPVDLALNSGVGGELTAEDCRILDHQVPSTSTVPADLHRLRVTEPSIVQLDLASPAIDSLLRLWAPNGTPITTNDDFSDDNLDSRIVIHLPPASYQVLATAFRGANDPPPAGPYELKAAAEPPRTCDIPPLAVNQAVEGPFLTEGCRLLDLVPFEEETAIVTPYKLTAARRSIVRIDYNVPNTPAAFDLIHPSLGIVTGGFTDRSGNAASELQLPVGEYTLALSAFAETTPPPFAVRATVRDVPDCPATELTLDATVEGVLTSSDCRFLEIVPLQRPTTRSKLYRLNLTQRGRVTFELTSQEFEPVLAIADADLRLAGVSSRPTLGTVGLVGTLPAGVYNIIVTTAVNNLGAFTLKTTFEAVAGPAPTSVGLALTDLVSSEAGDRVDHPAWQGAAAEGLGAGLRAVSPRRAMRRPARSKR